MKKIHHLLVSLLFSATSAFSQGASSDDLGNLRDIYGAPVRTINYSNTKGTPYLLDDWNIGTVKLQNGNSFKNIPLKYDIVNNVLIFKDSNGQPLGFKDPVQEFKMAVQGVNPTHELLFRKGYQPNPDHFFQVLAEGRVQLLKRTSKIVKESREFNSASTTKTFYPVLDYYIVKDGEMIRIRKFKNDVLANLDKKDQLIGFLEKNDFALKSEEDLIKVILHYNSL